MVELLRSHVPTDARSVAELEMQLLIQDCQASMKKMKQQQRQYSGGSSSSDKMPPRGSNDEGSNKYNTTSVSLHSLSINGSSDGNNRSSIIINESVNDINAVVSHTAVDVSITNNSNNKDCSHDNVSLHQHNNDRNTKQSSHSNIKSTSATSTTVRLQQPQPNQPHAIVVAQDSDGSDNIYDGLSPAAIHFLQSLPDLSYVLQQKE